MISRSQQSQTRLLFSSLVLLLFFVLSGCNQDGTALSDNHQPRARIAGSQVYTSGEIVTLDGSSSSDQDGDTLSYKWLRMEGQDFEFLGVTTATLSFVAPAVSETTRFTYKLIVGDGLLISTVSVSIQVSPSVHNTPSNQPPIARITGSSVYTAGQIVTLDGSSSSDPDGDTLSYYWVRMEEPGTEPSVASTATLRFVAPAVSQITRFTYKLSVGDGQLTSTTTASIQISPSTPTNQQPTARIAAPQSAISGQTVTLNGGSSSDPDGDTLRYQWTQTDGPGIVLSDSTGSSLTFVAPSVAQPQQISFKLTVRDGELYNSTDVSMLIAPIVDNSAPSLISSFPKPGQSDVPPTAQIRAGFDEALFAGSVNSQSFVLSQNGSRVPGRVSYDSSSSTIMFQPTSALSAGVSYTVTLAQSLTDIAGNAFAGAGWSFSTGVCGTAEENSSLTLSCPSGQVINEVAFASYGTPLGSCGSFTTGACSASNSMSVVANACKGMDICTLSANNETFGEACNGTTNKLAAQVVCAMARDSISTPDTGKDTIRSAKLEGYGENTTGGTGGSVATVSTGEEFYQALCSRAHDDTHLIIMIDGTINHANTRTASGSCNANSETIELKGVSNVSLIGVGDRGVLDQIGIHLRSSENIILQNLHIKNVKKSGSPISNGGDAIGMESGVNNVWIDHNTLEASGGESNGYDSLIDMKSGVSNVTISYNHLRNSSRGGLVGFSDSDDKNHYITFHHNWYENIEQRTPMLRNIKTAHIYNNFYSNQSNSDMIHGINSRASAQALVEKNYFLNSSNPLISSTDSPTAGCWVAKGNALENVIYTRTVENGKAHVQPGMVDGKAQGTVFDGDLSESNCSGEVIASYTHGYTMDDAAEIPRIVTENSGHGKIK